MLQNLQRFDVYRKVPKDLTQPTTTGALISIACVLVMACLVVAEFVSFLTPEVTTEMFVHDPKLNDERIPIKISIYFPKAQCQHLGLDIQDDSGRHDVGILENTHPKPIGANAEACLFDASFKVNKVPGNFHISSHGKQNAPRDLNLQHVVHSVIIGDDIPRVNVDIPGSFNPLYAVDQTRFEGQTSHEYTLRVVPSEVTYSDNFVIHPFQYTYAHRYFQPVTASGSQFTPTIWFRYDLMPITVSYTEKRKPLYHFLTTLFAIVGGTFTVASIIDSALFTATNLLIKQELGKHN